MTNRYFPREGKSAPLPANHQLGGFLEMMRLLPLLLFAALTSVAKGTNAPYLHADAEFKSLQSSLEMFRITIGRYPSGEEGLRALVEPPPRLSKPTRWRRFCDKMPRDPWGSPYGYVEGNGLGEGTGYGYGLYSMGPDGKTATQGNDPDDLNSWSGQIPMMPPPPWTSILDRDLPIAGVGFLLGILACRLRKSRSTPQVAGSSTIP